MKLHDLGLLWLRVLMGAGIASHGYGKVFGGHIDQFAQGVAKLGFPMPDAFAWAAALSEVLGGLCVALGLGTRYAAGAVFITMSVAAFRQHAADPFKTKELALAYWTMAGALVLLGGGAYALENVLRRGRSGGASRSSRSSSSSGRRP
jgi:putative oxidoreductase